MYAPLDNRKIKSHSFPSSVECAVDEVRSLAVPAQALLPFLKHQHPAYKGMSTNETKRTRAFLFEAFSLAGLPEQALPYVLEVLESEHHAYLVAGASMAIRGMKKPFPKVAFYLIQAIQNVKIADRYVSFGPGHQRYQTTAMHEICKTLQWLGGTISEVLEDIKSLITDPYLSNEIKGELYKVIQLVEKDIVSGETSCCDMALSHTKKRKDSRKHRLGNSLKHILLQDQNGHEIEFNEYFTGKPSLVVFFYTRCENPAKCSLTISRLRELQGKIEAVSISGDVRIAAITYDPEHDDPIRLKAYAEARGMTLDSHNSVFRVTAHMQDLFKFFDTGVNFMGSLVNHHATEVFILDHKGNLVKEFRQLRWNTADVIAELKECLEKQSRVTKRLISNFKDKFESLTSPILSFLIVFFPKCPFCLAAYMSVIGITNIHFLRFATKLLPLFVILLCINLYALYKGARRRNGLLPFYLSLAGLACIVLLSQVFGIQSAGYLAICFMLTGALLNSMPREKFVKLKLGFLELMQMNFRQINR
ncbi:SCO family protein [Dyadobacter sp. CY326]|uniref:SCO family protein n=1 Tax=Dyadobacter sp. CY326 TaxID=2907300 RepID=UPI001F33369A|nr:SCO family protein [Dyadobacter sp. CY326]MCE7065270.1 SCO family protein [Dyadobacter sp. CY326]